MLQYFLNIFPQFDIVQFFQGRITDQNLNFIILFICVGVVEEIVKQAIIRIIDNKYLLIKTINDSIRFSFVGALGFSFAENIFYIFNIYTALGVQQLIIAYLFRSLFTTTAHLMFSGFFGYYYGIAKFSINIIEQSKAMGKKHPFALIIGRILNISNIQAFKELMILRGLFLAIILHALFNFLLQLNMILPVVVFVVCGFTMLQYLLKRKTGKLVLVTDASMEQTSTMAKTDEDVVIELMGLWFNQKKYVDVLHICHRLLERDPGNKVVQLFKTKAIDNLDEDSPYNKILKNIFPKEEVKSLHELVAKSEKPQTVIQPMKIEIESQQNQSESKQKDANGYYDLNI